MSQDAQLIEYLLLLRFGTKVPHPHDKPLLNLTAIAKMVKKPVATIRNLIMLGLQAHKDQRMIVPKCRSKLQSFHIDFLLSHHTLREWAHLSL